jgi:hypothetical protein
MDSTKRIRSDRSQKLKNRKFFKETVVKAALLKHLHGTSEQKQKVVSAIKQRVKCFSKRLHMASLTLGGYVKQIFDGVEDVSKADAKDIFDTTFIRQVMVGVEDARRNFPRLQSFLKNNPVYSITAKRHLGDRNIYSAGAITYVTNLKNSMTTTFSLRLKQFLKNYQKTFGITDAQRIAMLYQINGWKLTLKEVPTIEGGEHFEEIQKHRKILNLGIGDQITEGFLKKPKSLESLLKYYVYLNRFYETHNFRCFNLVPVTTIKSHNITIDSSVLFGIMKDVGLCNPTMTQTTFEGMSLDHWKSFLKFEKLEGKGCTFTKTINTDGISMSCHFQRRKEESESTKVTIGKGDRVVAVDPGRVVMFYGVEKLSNGKVKEHILSRKQYYNDCGINTARRQVQRWTQRIQKRLDKLSKVSTKGCNLRRHQEYMKTYLKVKNSLWKEYTKARWSRQRFRLYSGKKRVFARFFNSIKNFDKSKAVKIAYGSAKFAPTGKGEVAVPTTQVFKECNYRFPTILVDEYLTTKIHCETNTVLEKVKIKGQKNCLRGLLWCNSPQVSKFVSRDKNAALNILRCAMSSRRPTALSRGQQKVSVPVGKHIKRHKVL